MQGGLFNLSDFDNDFILSNPYKQFTYTIPNEESETIFYNFSFFQILELSNATGVEVRFGGSAGFTDITSAGVGYELPTGKITNRVDITNNSGSSIQITVALAIGKINDQRFTASGVVTTRDVATTFESKPRVIVSTTAISLAGANSDRREIVIYNSSSITTVYLGNSIVTTSAGTPLLPRQTAVFSTTAEIFAITGGGAAVPVYVTEMEY